MEKLLKNPFTEWKNLTRDPEVVIKGDIVIFGEKFPFLNQVVGTLKKGGKDLDKTITKIASLDIHVKNKEKELALIEKRLKNPKAKQKLLEEKRKRLEKDLTSLLKKKESLSKGHRGVEDDFIKKAANSYVVFIDLINIIYRLNIQCLTLIHRSRRDLNEIIDKVKSFKHAEVGELEKLKAESIEKLNKAKEHLIELCDHLFRSSEYQNRSGFNPTEIAKEFSPQATPVMIRRTKRLAIALNLIQKKIDSGAKGLPLPQLIEFTDKYIISMQVPHLKHISENIKILTHRFHKVLHEYPENKKLKKPFKKVLKRIEKQTRLLWNSIKIHPYKAKVQKQVQGKAA